MTYTHEKPTEPGWYWYLSANEDDGQWREIEPFIIHINSAFRRGVSFGGSDVTESLASAHGQFAGPINPPPIPE